MRGFVGSTNWVGDLGLNKGPRLSCESSPLIRERFSFPALYSSSSLVSYFLSFPIISYLLHTILLNPHLTFTWMRTTTYTHTPMYTKSCSYRAHRLMTAILTTLSHLGWHLYRACDLSKKSFDKVRFPATSSLLMRPRLFDGRLRRLMDVM